MVQVPTPTMEQVMIFLAGFLIGLPAPYWYAQERVRGFTRAILKQLPYEPPPGEDKQEAMKEAVNAENEDDEDGQTESNNSSN